MRCLALQSQKQSGCSSGPPPALPLRCPGGGGHPGSPRRPARPAPTPTPWPLRHLLLGPCLRAQTDGWEGGWGPAVLPALPGLKLSLCSILLRPRGAVSPPGGPVPLLCPVPASAVPSPCPLRSPSAACSGCPGTWSICFHPASTPRRCQDTVPPAPQGPAGGGAHGDPGPGPSAARCPGPGQDAAWCPANRKLAATLNAHSKRRETGPPFCPCQRAVRRAGC